MEKDRLKWGADHLGMVTIWFDLMGKENLRLSELRHYLNLDYSMVFLYLHSSSRPKYISN